MIATAPTIATTSVVAGLQREVGGAPLLSFVVDPGRSKVTAVREGTHRRRSSARAAIPAR
jgi:hypothetical protein